MKFWTLYWRSGNHQFLTGPTIEAAFTKAGYGAGAISVLDFYKEGLNFDYVWLSDSKEWKKLPSAGAGNRWVPLDTMSVDGVKIIAINMQPLLNEAHARGKAIRLHVPEGGGPGVGWVEYFRDGLVRVHVDDLAALWEIKLG